MQDLGYVNSKSVYPFQNTAIDKINATINIIDLLQTIWSKLSKCCNDGENSNGNTKCNN